MNGGGDLDYASYVNATVGVGLNLTTGVHTGEALGDTFVNIERYRLSAFADTFTGSAALTAGVQRPDPRRGPVSEEYGTDDVVHAHRATARRAEVPPGIG